MSQWTHFWDMHSGGGSKEKWGHIFIEASKEEAKVIFYNRFGHNPERVSCTCCGQDYSISEESSLEQATAYQRGCTYVYFRPDGTECDQDEAWKSGQGLLPGYTGRYVERQSERFSLDRYVPLHTYLKTAKVHVIRASEITAQERVGTVPEQGYVWVD